jgi:hypothetical protein
MANLDARGDHGDGLRPDAATAEDTIARLLAGDGTVLTEIVKDGKIERFQDRPDEELATVSDVRVPFLHADFVRDIMDRFATIGTLDTARRALVESLLAKLAQLRERLDLPVKRRP